MARHLKRRRGGWYFILDIPAHLRSHFEGRVRIEQTLSTRDEALAAAKAQRLAGEYKLRFLALEGNADAGRAQVRNVYETALASVVAGELCGDDARTGVDVAECVSAEIDLVLDSAPVTEAAHGPELTPDQLARVAGLNDGLARRGGQPPRYRGRYEQPFKELADRWLQQWKARPGRKVSNTGLQYEATIRLFHEFWGSRPIREVRGSDAAEFIELLKRLPPTYGRGKLKGVPLPQAVDAVEGPGRGLSGASIKRHLGVLKQIWVWAKGLGHCEGENPFQVRIPKERVQTYLAWPTAELRHLLEEPPRRRDVYEAFHIAMFTGLRVSEVADMDWSQVRKEGGIAFIKVEDAKTDAGQRRVPLHPKLDWLLAKRKSGQESGPVFPTFNPEGPGKRRGADASRLFGAWKRSRGITSRRYVFHSARKNVTGIMEEHSIPANQWARLIGHEPGFTYGTYNPSGLSLAKSKEIMSLIDYPEVDLKTPPEIYGDAFRLPKDRRK